MFKYEKKKNQNSSSTVILLIKNRYMRLLSNNLGYVRRALKSKYIDTD